MLMKSKEAFISYKKHSLFIKEWSADAPKAHLFVIHGLGEHSGAYGEMAQYLNAQGISCYATDLIGHGKSSGQRGYIPSLQEYISQLDFVVEHLIETFNIEELHVFSHSLGGLLHLKKLQSNDQISDFVGFKNQKTAIFSNPLLGIKVEVPKWKLQIAKNITHVLPRLALHNEIDKPDLSNDPKMLDIYQADPLRHTKISARLFVEIQDAVEELEYQLPSFKLNTLLMLSPSDNVCNAEKAQSFFEKHSNTSIELFPQSGHEIINDLSKLKAFDKITDFILGAKA